MMRFLDEAKAASIFAPKLLEADNSSRSLNIGFKRRGIAPAEVTFPIMFFGMG